MGLNIKYLPSGEREHILVDKLGNQDKVESSEQGVVGDMYTSVCVLEYAHELYSVPSLQLRIGQTVDYPCLGKIR